MNRVLITTYAIVFAVVCCVFILSTAHATGTTIQAITHDNAPATISVTTPADGITVNSSSLMVTGSLHNVSQIMVYVDGIYSSTVPINVGASTFTLALVLSPGSHTIRLTGIDPYTSAQVEQVFTVNYVPTNTPDQSTSPQQDVAGVVIQQSQQAVSDASASAREQISQASSSGPMKLLTDRLYAALVSVNLITPTDHFGINAMFPRFLFVAFGLMLLVMPWEVLLILRRTKLAPTGLKRTANMTVPVRLIGTMLVLVPFLFLV